MKRLGVILFIFLLAPLFCSAADTVTIKTEDGWEISALYEASSNGSFVILLHDLGKDRSEFSKLQEAISKDGFGFLTLDLRGHGRSTNKGAYKAFTKTGTDNEFNQMVRDITAAIAFLNKKGIPTGKIFLAGSGLGANVAAKSLIFNPDIAGIALFTPSLKTRDVLTMNGIKINTKPVFIAVSSLDRKQMMEASFIRNAAFLSSGEGKVTFMTAYNLTGVEMINRYLTDEFIQWLNTPERPQIIEDAVEETGGVLILQPPTVTHPL